MGRSDDKQGTLTPRVIRLLFQSIEQNGPVYQVAERSGVDKGQLSRVRKKTRHLGLRHLEALLRANGTTEPTFWGQLFLEARFRAADAFAELLACGHADPEDLADSQILELLEKEIREWRHQPMGANSGKSQRARRELSRAAILQLDDDRLVDSAAAQTKAVDRMLKLCAAPFSAISAAHLAILLALWGAARRVEGARHEARKADLLALELLPAAQDRFAEGFVLQKVAWVLAAYNRFGQAGLALDQANQCFILAAQPVWLAKVTIDHGHLAHLQGHLDAAEEWLKAGLALAPKHLAGYRFAAHDILAKVFLQRDSPELALREVRHAAEYVPSTPSARGYLKWREGTLLVQVQQYAAAETLLEEAIDALAELGEPLDLAIATWDLAVVYQIQGKSAKLQSLTQRTFSWLHRLRPHRTARKGIEELLAAILRGNLSLDWLLGARKRDRQQTPACQIAADPAYFRGNTPSNRQE